MKLRQLIVLTGISLFTHAAFANITVQSFSLTAGQGCDNFAGKWIGAGTIKATVIFPIVCHYNGVATVAPNGNGYNVHVDLTKDSGICPDHESLDLPGTCQNGAINLQTDSADLHGDVNAAGTEANLAGTVKFAIGSSTVKADVTDMHLKKQ